MAVPRGVAGAVSDVASNRSPEVVRLLGSMLAPTLLGNRVPVDMYARCGFRFLAVPACVDAKQLALRCQQFKSRLRINVNVARDGAIRTISDDHLDGSLLSTAVTRLESPRHRFVCELFWTHVTGPDFDLIRNIGHLGASDLLRHFKPNGKVGLDHAKRVHTMALARHCLAIDSECGYLEKNVPASESHWELAIQHWRELCASDVFWQYLGGRAASFDDPRIRKGDVDTARAELPAVILAYHEMLAEFYAERERYEDCARHLDLISRSGFPAAVVRAATRNAVRRVVGAQLEGIDRRLEESVGKLPEDNDRGHLEAVLGPFLQEAFALRELLAGRLRLTDSVLEQPGFDSLAGKLALASHNKLRFNSDQRERNLLWRGLFLKKMLRLPLSSAQRSNVEREMRKVDSLLFEDYGSESLPKCLECLFMPGAEANPADSIVVPIYRVTKREVKVDRVRRTAGISVGYTSTRILIPRSAEGKKLHGKVTESPVPEAGYTPQQRAVADQIKGIESKSELALAGLRARCDVEVKTAEAPAADDIARRFGARLPRLEDEIKASAKAEREALDAEAEIRDAAERHIGSEHTSALRAMEKRRASFDIRFDGFPGILKLGGPVALVIALASYHNLGMGLFSGVFAGAVVASLIRPLARFWMAAPQRAYNAALAANERALVRRQQEIKGRFATARKKPEAELDALKLEKATAEMAMKEKSSALRRSWDQKIAKATAEAEGKIRPLQSKLVRQIKVKSEAERKNFPPLVAALKKGFREGLEPSAFEMQMTAAERMQAQLMLR